MTQDLQEPIKITVKESIKSTLPTPEDDKDRMRWFMTAGIFGAGIVVTAAALLYSLILWLGDWSGDTEGTRLNYLGAALVIAWFSIIVVVTTFGLGGPLGRLKGSIGNLNIEAEGNANVDQNIRK